MKFFILILIILILSGCENGEDVLIEEVTEETEAVAKEYLNMDEIEILSKKVNNWGMRRNPPNRPEFTSEQISVMDKYGCIYLGSSEEKYLYLTFDEGYENGQSGKILDVLKEKNVPAAFFITGDFFKSETDLVDRMVKEGHIVGNHTMKHPCVPKLKSQKIMEEEILSLDRIFYERYKKHMKYFRPPEGAYSEFSLGVTYNLGYTNVFWSFAYDDWYTDKQRGWEYAYDKTISNIHPGCVILLHAVSEDNANALGKIIDSLREEGYEFKSLDCYIP